MTRSPSLISRPAAPSIFPLEENPMCSNLRRRVSATHVVRFAERAQGTAEYALVLVAVTAMVGVVIAYVSGGGGGMITSLFGAVFAKMRSLVGG